MPTAALYGTASLFRVISLYVSPIPKRKAANLTKAPGGQFHPSTKVFPTRGINRTSAVITAGPFQRLLRCPPSSFVLPATVLFACVLGFMGVQALQHKVNYEVQPVKP